MRNCLGSGQPCWFSVSDNPKRKYPFSWEVATTPQGDLAVINTGRANHLVVEAIEAGIIKELDGYGHPAEVKYGEERSRIDILLQAEGQPDCYVEMLHLARR